MEAARLLVVVAAVLGFISTTAERHYKFVQQMKTWPEAQRYCSDNHDGLASVHTIEDMQFLISLAKTSGMFGDFWMGLYENVNSWRWSMSDADFYPEGEAEFRDWGPGQPNNLGNAERCTSMRYTGEWHDYSCDSPLQAVCADVTGATATFVLTEDNLTWPEAQRFCRNNHKDLASVRNKTENEMIHGLIPADRYIWIGLYREDWNWTDGSKLSFNYWAPGEPSGGDESCAVTNFTNSGLWEDWNCNREASFICNVAPPKHVVKVKVKVKGSSGLDLNDPVVMERALEQLKQKLKEKGVNSDIKLSWRKQSDGKVFHKEKKKSEL
ncbi:macrophage mannose receptor 1-like [Cololabis saira]|uniref:macrophage mannose receptor 1-like n=1 Tax=Cololabis saira TaxID=129043 RepID=UPI002AD45A7D|nr:macrophage mannose receptor 1-like [Cololabis saira]